MSTGRDIAKGIAWLKMIARIADRRGAREKVSGPRSTLSPTPFSGGNSGGAMGGPGVISEWFIQSGPDVIPGYTVVSAATPEVAADWPSPSGEFTTSIGAAPPILGDRAALF